jgi:hypothetical protein
MHNLMICINDQYPSLGSLWYGALLGVLLLVMEEEPLNF